MESILKANIIVQAARDYDLHLEVVEMIYKQCQANGTDLYEALEEYIKRNS